MRGRRPYPMLLNKAKRIALMGVLLALVIITLYAESVFPTGKLSLYALSSFFTAVVIIEVGIKSAWLFYVSACLMSVILLPEKLAVIPYMVFFGLYGIFKYYIEKKCGKLTGYVLKFLAFNTAVSISYLFAKNFISQEAFEALPLWLVIPVLQLIFLLYDYVYSLFIEYFQLKIRKIIKF
jgi:magnesium-transporting ATPase (P-type)